METVIFEVLPPPITWDDDKIDRYCQDIVHVLREQNLFTVCVPEVVNESKEQEREVAYIPKIDNVDFVLKLKSHFADIVPIVCKISVRDTKPDFHIWLDKTYSAGVHHIVLVGGEKHSIDYPGYSVIEGARTIKNRYPEMKLGAIAIFTREKEVQRIHDKMVAGIDFFISQIIFEASNMKQVAVNLSKLCHHEELSFPHLFLSIALASKTKDIDFMKWLGVEFPSAVYAFLKEENHEGLETRTQESIDLVLDEIFHFMEKEKLDLGFNIEHVMYANLLLSQKLIKNVKQRIAVV